MGSMSIWHWAIVVVVVNMLTDLVYGLVDPRIWRRS